MKILLIRLSAFGDIIHALPCLTALRRQLPRSYIAWLVEEPFKDILAHHPHLDELFVIPKWSRTPPQKFLSQTWKTIRQLRRRQFDVAIDFQGLTKSGLYLALSGAPQRIGFGDEQARELNWLFTTTQVPTNGTHVIEKNLSLLKPLRLKVKHPEFIVPIKPSELRYVREWLEQQLPAPGPRIALNPFAGWETKRLPDSTLIELIRQLLTQLKAQVILLWGHREQVQARALKQSLDPNSRQLLIAPPTDQRQLGALLSQCHLYIGGDTGPTHLAAALGIPVVTFYGGSDANRNAPRSQQGFIIQHAHIPCVPCWRERCPFRKSPDHLRCLHEITADEILSATQNLLALVPVKAVDT